MRARAGRTARPTACSSRDRAASGWSVRLILVLGVIPFALGVVDLLVRVRRRRLPLAPARTRPANAARPRPRRWRPVLVRSGTGDVPDRAPRYHCPRTPTSSRSHPLPAYSPSLPPSRSSGSYSGGRSGRRARPPHGSADGSRCCARAPRRRSRSPSHSRIRTPSSSCCRRSTPGSGSRSRDALWVRVAAFVAGLAGPAIGVLLLGNELGTSPIESVLYLVASRRWDTSR